MACIPLCTTTAHQRRCSGCIAGPRSIRVGGESRAKLSQVAAGDVIVIPAGVPHQNVGSSRTLALSELIPKDVVGTCFVV